MSVYAATGPTDNLASYNAVRFLRIVCTITPNNLHLLFVALQLLRYCKFGLNLKTFALHVSKLSRQRGQ